MITKENGQKITYSFDSNPALEIDSEEITKELFEALEKKGYNAFTIGNKEIIEKVGRVWSGEGVKDLIQRDAIWNYKIDFYREEELINKLKNENTPA